MFMAEEDDGTAIEFHGSKQGSPNMIIEDAAANQNPPPKKRAEAWSQEETRSLISLRKETDLLFNTSKSNKHLWDNISIKMREKGFDRSPTMCTDKWRNLLKEFKKPKHNNQDGNSKMSFYNDIEEIMMSRRKNSVPSTHKLDSFLQFYDKGIDDTSLFWEPMEDNVRSTLNLERPLDHEAHPLANTDADAVGASGVSPWNWRETPGNDEHRSSYDSRVITVKLGDYTKRIGIDGTADAIKEALKAAFRLRTKRAFWLEGEDNVVRSLDRDMPLGNYTLYVDEGLTIKICLFDDPDPELLSVHTEEKTFYTEDDFRGFLSRRRWTCLREFDGFRNVDSMDQLCPGALYRGLS